MDLLEVEAISDNDEECYYFNEYGTVKKICGLLNNLDEDNNRLIATNNGLNAEYEWLKEENEKLKKAEILANYRGEMIGFATALIDDLGSQTMKEMWDKFKNGKYEKWCELE